MTGKSENCSTGSSSTGLAAVAWSIPAQLPKILVSPSGGPQKPHKHGIGYKQHMSSPIIKHFCVSLFAVVDAAEDATNLLAQSARSLHPQVGNSRVMLHGDVSLGRPWYRGFWDKKIEREKQLTTHDRSKRLLGILGMQMLGAEEEGSDPSAVKMSMECSKGGSDLEVARCHKRVPVDEHEGAKQVAVEEVDKEFFDQRISPAVVTISDEEGEIDMLVKSGM